MTADSGSRHARDKPRTIEQLVYGLRCTQIQRERPRQTTSSRGETQNQSLHDGVNPNTWRSSRKLRRQKAQSARAKGSIIFLQVTCSQ